MNGNMLRVLDLCTSDSTHSQTEESLLVTTNTCLFCIGDGRASMSFVQSSIEHNQFSLESKARENKKRLREHQARTFATNPPVTFDWAGGCGSQKWYWYYLSFESNIYDIKIHVISQECTACYSNDVPSRPAQHNSQVEWKLKHLTNI